jgi:probable phosphoglycerate mutase
MTLIKRIPFYFVRHGQTDYNKQGLYMGQLDIPLNQTGIVQAQEAGVILKSVGIKTVCYSPLKRAAHTAILINQTIQAQLIELPDIKELCLGPLEGQGKTDAEWFDNWRNGNHAEGVEPHMEFVQRVIAGITKALEHPGPVLLVSHSGVFRTMQRILNLSVEDISHANPVLLSPPDRDRQPWLVCAVDDDGGEVP